MKNRILAVLLVIAMAVIFVPTVALAADVDTGSITALQSALDTASANATAGAGDTKVTLKSNITDWTGVDNLTVAEGVELIIDAGVTLTIPNTKTLTIEANATLTVKENATLTIEDNGLIINEGTITNNGTITGNIINGEGTVEVQSLDNLQKALELLAHSIKMTDNIIIGDTVTVSIPHNVKLNTGGKNLTVEAGGALKVTDGGTLIVEGELTVENGGELTVVDPSLGIIGTGTVNVAEESALLTALDSEVGKVKLTANITITTGNSVTIADGTLDTGEHSLTVDEGATVSIQSSGELIVSADGVFTLNGVLSINGTFINNGTTTFGALSEVKLESGGTLTNNNELSVEGTLMLIYGTFSNNGTPFTVSGTFIIQNGATLSANASGREVMLAEGGIIYSVIDFTDNTSPFEIIGSEHLFALNADGGTHAYGTEFVYIRGVNTSGAVTLSATPTNPTKDGIELRGWTYGTINGTKTISPTELATNNFIDATELPPKTITAQWQVSETSTPLPVVENHNEAQISPATGVTSEETPVFPVAIILSAVAVVAVGLVVLRKRLSK